MQGVGFRPFAKRLADQFRLSGTVANTPDGVVIEIEVPDRGALTTFVNALHNNPPNAAIIQSCEVTEMGETVAPTGFDIG